MPDAVSCTSYICTRIICSTGKTQNMTHNYQAASAVKRIIGFLIDRILMGVLVCAFLFVRMGKAPEDSFVDEGTPSLADKYQFVATAEAVAFDPQRMIYLKSFVRNYPMEAGLCFVLLPFVYFVLFEGLWGGTFGKLLLGIRVKRKDGGAISFVNAIIRHVGRIICSVTFGLGYLLAFFDGKKQALHDKIANTLVLNKGTGI